MIHKVDELNILQELAKVANIADCKMKLTTGIWIFANLLWIMRGSVTLTPNKEKYVQIHEKHLYNFVIFSTCIQGINHGLHMGNVKQV